MSVMEDMSVNELTIDHHDQREEDSSHKGTESGELSCNHLGEQLLSCGKGKLLCEVKLSLKSEA